MTFFVVTLFALIEEAIVSHIKWQVRARMLAKGYVKIVGNNLGLVHHWNLQNLIQG
jgi:hypothetical protein